MGIILIGCVHEIYLLRSALFFTSNRFKKFQYKHSTLQVKNINVVYEKIHSYLSISIFKFKRINNAVLLDFFSCTRSRIRHRSSNIDHATVTWIEMGLDRVQSEVEIKASALKKWQGFLKQHVMQNLERVSYK